MASLLEKLVAATDKSDYKLTKSAFGDKGRCVLHKGIYPYEYIDILDRFNETQLPSIASTVVPVRVSQHR